MKKNIGNLITVGFFVVALVLFFLSGVKGSPLQTLGGIKEEPAETEIERPQDWDDDSWRALMRMLDRNVETIDLNGVRYRLVRMENGGYRVEGEPIPGQEPHTGPSAGLSDEELLRDPDALRQMIETESYDGCELWARDFENYGGLAVLRTEKGYFSREFGLKRCSCGRLIAVPSGEYMVAVARVVQTSDPLHVHWLSPDAVGTEQQDLLCQAEDNTDGHGVTIRFPDTGADFQIVCDGNRTRLFFTKDEEADVMRYLRLWLTARAENADSGGEEEP